MVEKHPDCLTQRMLAIQCGRSIAMYHTRSVERFRNLSTERFHSIASRHEKLTEICTSYKQQQKVMQFYSILLTAKFLWFTSYEISFLRFYFANSGILEMKQLSTSFNPSIHTFHLHITKFNEMTRNLNYYKKWTAASGKI